MRNHIWENNSLYSWACQTCGYEAYSNDAPDTYKEYGKAPWFEDPILGDPVDCNESICKKVLEA